MPLKIVGAGFGRTGTMSLYTALNEVGYPCYHMLEVVQNKRNKSHLDFWCKVADGEPGTQFDWEEVFARYTAAVDNPASCVWRELVVAYPDAKVILTVHPRGAQAWYESTIDTIYFTETMWQFKVLEFCTSFGKKFGQMSRKLIWQRNHKGTMNERGKAIAHYDQYIEEVKRSVPPEKLLVFSAEQGWAPLCAFLGVPIPSTAFPNVNDRAQIKAGIRRILLGGYLIVGIATLIVAGAIYWVARMVS